MKRDHIRKIILSLALIAFIIVLIADIALSIDGWKRPRRAMDRRPMERRKPDDKVLLRDYKKPVYKKAIMKIRVSPDTDKVKIINALPLGKNGAEIKERPSFSPTIVENKDGFVTLEMSTEPIWIIEGDLPKNKTLKTEESPFGFHPAAVNKTDYRYAKEIGVDWDRGGTYFMWFLGQPDPKTRQYNWKMYDRYFESLPKGMKAIKNITVGILKKPGRHRFPMDKNRPEIDVSRHIEDNSYRPKDVKEYRRWVKAVVERYDGDGVEDMPGLKVPVKYWQVDNEPSRRKGERYTDLFNITSSAIKEADQQAQVLVGGLWIPVGYNLLRYERASLPIIKELEGKSIDIFDFHWHGKAGEWKLFPQAIARVRQDLENNGFGNIPIWITEMCTYSGQPFHWRFGEYPKQSEREQAVEIIKRHAVALGEGVKRIFTAWGIMEGFGAPRDNDIFDNTGFIYDGIGPNDHGKGVKKIVYWSYQKMTQLLSYWDGSKPKMINIGNGILGYRFKFNSNEERGIIIAWIDE